MAVVYALDKFRAYLVGSDIIIFTDHSTLKYLLTKKNAKARLIIWVLPLQKFNLQIKDKKGEENVIADHLSQLTLAHNTHNPPINDEFPKESLLLVEKAPWYAHIANFLAQKNYQLTGRLKTGSSSLQRFIPTIEKSHSCPNIVQIRQLKDVFLRKNSKEYSATTMRVHVEVILLPRRLP